MKDVFVKRQSCADRDPQPVPTAGSEPSGREDRWGEDWCEDFRDEDEEDGDFECGAFINGRFDYAGCQLAGTEDCDWECPYSAGVRGLK